MSSTDGDFTAPSTEHPSAGVAELCEAIWAAEREFELLDWNVGGVWIWQALRFEAYKRLASRAGAFHYADAGGARKDASKIRRGLQALRGSLRRSPYFGSETFDTLVFESPRTKLVDGRRICIYTDELVRELTAAGERVQLLELPDAGAHTKDPDPRRVHLDVVELLAAVRGIARERLGARDTERARAVERFFGKELGISLALRRRVEAYVPEFRARTALYRRLLAKRRPKRLFCVCSYGRLAPLMKAAREEGVKSIELQHGIVSRYHMGYGFPIRPKTCCLEYLPDSFYSWGETWTELMELPLDPERVVAYGFRHFERTRAKYANVAREPGRVLVLSQPALGPKLADRLLENIDAFVSSRIDYKLHPREYAEHHRYPSLTRLSQRPNVHIVTDVDLYDLMARAEVQIGVFSTAIYEGLQFGCKTVLVDLPGIEYMQKVVATGRTETFDAFVARLRSGRSERPEPPA